MKISKKVQEVISLVDYNPETGSFKFKERGCPKFDTMYAGKEAGSISASGYLIITLKGRSYSANRLAYAIMTGRFPSKRLHVDHKDKVKLNNKWSNLRLSTPSQNACNKSIRRTSKSKAVGVSLCKQTGLWLSRCSFKKKTHFLGRFKTKMLAATARDNAAKKLHGEFVSLNLG